MPLPQSTKSSLAPRPLSSPVGVVVVGENSPQYLTPSKDTGADLGLSGACALVVARVLCGLLPRPWHAECKSSGQSSCDAFALAKEKVIAATTHIDILDPALLRSGRLDRKIEFPLPNDTACAGILKIHSRKMAVSEGVNHDGLVRSTDEFNGAQLNTVEAGMIARSGTWTRIVPTFH
ncbi:hypothetical protein B0H16DRAFT_1887528 [Mycena metata]|uniref:ATPase AAA-type core domain-containing protein n=1 Tax=Mycena metata TaxID=1033252 RepID=A0AAD7IYZ7_9AGAR|nr:hypothetical protein B0H16DRAFT_1887528 [Mycena metata]